MGGGVQHGLEGELERLESFQVEEEEKCPFLTSTETSSSHIQPQPSGAVASLELPYGVSVNLPANNHQSSTLASIACDDAIVSTSSIAGPDTGEVIPNMCNTEIATNDDRNLTPYLVAAKEFESFDRNPEIASTLDVMKHYFERGDIANDAGRNNHEAEAAVNLGLLIQKIQSHKKLLHEQIHTIRDKREKICSYKPGDGFYEAGGVNRMDVAIPEMTTLLLVGPSGAGKSTLINNIIRVLNSSTSGFDRAQAYEEKGNGSLFLQEYLVYTAASHFLVFDSRGFSEKHTSEDLDVARKWMMDGISHGEPVCRPSDNVSTKEALEGRSRQRHDQLTSKREVNFVIFVVNALSVHNWKESQDILAIENLVALYKNPYLTFKDDRPVVVMTHGDRLSPENGILTRILIGKVFGVSPLDHIFDISCCTARSVNPGEGDPVSDLVLLNMLEFALARADRNLPYKSSAASRFAKVRIMANEAVVDCWNNIDDKAKTVLIALFFYLLVCFAILAARQTNHKHNPWQSLQCFGMKKSMDWLKKGLRRC